MSTPLSRAMGWSFLNGRSKQLICFEFPRRDRHGTSPALDDTQQDSRSER
jgi:hypothetical protein